MGLCEMLRYDGGKVLAEKNLEHQKELLHGFIDFKKAFDRVWHDGLW